MYNDEQHHGGSAGEQTESKRGRMRPWGWPLAIWLGSGALLIDGAARESLDLPSPPKSSSSLCVFCLLGGACGGSATAPAAGGAAAPL